MLWEETLRKIKSFAGNVCFSEFDDAANLLAANPDAVTISIDEPTEKPKKKHGRLHGSGREEDDDLLGTDDSDKTEVWWKYTDSIRQLLFFFILLINTAHIVYKKAVETIKDNSAGKRDTRIVLGWFIYYKFRLQLETI